MPNLDSLNTRQQEAVTHGGGPLVVFAGAGSGKTRVITYRIAHLIDEERVPPHQILAVTFTNKAAAEMRERLEHLVQVDVRAICVGTFHATCARLLRQYHDLVGIRRDYTIYDDSDQRAMITRVLRDLKLDEKRYPPKALGGEINRAKQEGVGPEQFAVHDAMTEITARVYETYEQRMRQAGALDFGDLIYQLVIALEKNLALRTLLCNRFTHVLVDEFQDTNHIQYRLVRTLCANHRSLFVVGDDDQSIYRWRGADRRNILDFRREFPDASIVKLEQNYRSTKRILATANAVISRNIDREPKQLWTDNDDGEKIRVVRCEDERDEARIVVQAAREFRAEGHSLREMALLYRIHAQSRVFEEALRAAKIQYQIIGGMKFYERAEIKDLLAYLRVIQNPDDDVSLLRIINTPSRGIGKATIDSALDIAANDKLSFWSALSLGTQTTFFSTGSKKSVAGFLSCMEELREMSKSGAGIHQLATAVLEKTEYVQSLRNEDSAEADARIQNLQELLGSIEEFQKESETPTLQAFLEQVTLQTDEERGESEERLTLMTVHAAKGLEFPVIFVAGLEEDTFPFSSKAFSYEPEALEEERRLAYVAFTRARKRLLLSHTAIRRVFGQTRVCRPSRFLSELPEDAIDAYNLVPSPSPRMSAASYTPHARFAARPTRSSRESYVDRSDASDSNEVGGLRLGMRVRHAKFGIGKVQGIQPGAPPRVTVAFPQWGTKHIVAGFLEPVN